MSHIFFYHFFYHFRDFLNTLYFPLISGHKKGVYITPINYLKCHYVAVFACIWLLLYGLQTGIKPVEFFKRFIPFSFKMFNPTFLMLIEAFTSLSIFNPHSHYI